MTKRTVSVFYLRLNKIATGRYFCEEERGNCTEPAVFAKLRLIAGSERHLTTVRFLCFPHYRKEAK